MLTDRRRSRIGALVAPALLLAASPALAQDATHFGTEADYEAAAGPSDGCLDFNGSPGLHVFGGTFSGDVTFGSPEALDPTAVNWSSDAISDAGSTSSVNDVGPLAGTFTGTAMAFKFVFLSNSIPATVELYAEDTSLIASIPSPTATGFFGVVSTVPVKHFLILPGEFDPLLGTRDRFFIDDFCFTAFGEEPPPPPPPPSGELMTLCDDLAAAVAAADGAAYRGRNRQRALGNKLRVVCDRIEAGDVESLCGALRKLENDLLPKVDGEPAPRDWTLDDLVRQDLEDRMTALAAALADAIEALGGCPHDGDEDAEEDPDAGEGDDGGVSAASASDGRGNGRGNGNGNGKGRGRGRK
jgi:hypothetical protein